MRRYALLLVFALAAGCQQINWLDDPKWDHVPITVDWSKDLDDVMPWALGNWNHAAGCKVVVRYVPPVQPTSITPDAVGAAKEPSTAPAFPVSTVRVEAPSGVMVGGSAPDVTFGDYDGTACGRPANLGATGDAVAGAWRCSPTHAEVKFKVLSDIRSNGIVATHEMGHVLGLAHDSSPLMKAAPELYHPEQLSGNAGLLPWPSDADGAAVGARYCR